MEYLIPTPIQIREARQSAGLTQAQAGKLLHSGQVQFARWESGSRKMHPAFWELFCIKTRACAFNPSALSSEPEQP